MSRRRKRVPSYRLHKASGQGVVTLDGKDFYLGEYGSPESEERYRRLLAEYLATGRAAPEPSRGLTIAELADRYIRHVQQWYVDRKGRPSKQQHRILRALDKLVRLYAECRADQFGPRALRTVRESMVQANWSRNYANHATGCIKKMFRWAVTEELIKPHVYAAVKELPQIPRGRGLAKENEPVRPVAWEDVEPILQMVLPPVAAMMRLQWLTGMRSEDVVQLRPGDIDRKGQVWTYRPQTHKMQYRGQERVVCFGPKAQEVLAPFLLRAADAFCFSPREAMEKDRQKKDQKVKFGGRGPGDCYNSGSYRHAVRAGIDTWNKACEQAETLAQLLGVKVEGIRRVTPWHPHQLRHAAGTRVRAHFGPDAARAVLGHESLDATEIYAELSLEKAQEVALKIG